MNDDELKSLLTMVCHQNGVYNLKFIACTYQKLIHREQIYFYWTKSDF